MRTKQWLAKRKKAGLKINPETAEVMWTVGCFLDPYNIEPERFEEQRPLGDVYFARSPGSDIWVWIGDLPSAVCDELMYKHKL